MVRSRDRAPAASDPDAGILHGASIARRHVSPDGFTVLVGRSAADNDALSFKLATGADFWFHAAGTSGAHVVVRNPDRLDRLPRDTLRFAAALAAAHSGGRAASRVAVHVARCSDLRKPRGAPPGTVSLRRSATVRVAPLLDATAGSGGAEDAS
jgi:predicted ribosome quality control (RQC) complex YloA/Tae2 family protein